MTTPPAGENTTARSDAPVSSRAWRLLKGSAVSPGLPPGPAPSAPALRTPADAATASSAPGAGSSRPGSARRKRVTRPESASPVLRGAAAPPSRGGADAVSCRLPARRFCLLLMASPLLTPLLTASALRKHAACTGDARTGVSAAQARRTLETTHLRGQRGGGRGRGAARQQSAKAVVAR